MVIEIYINSWIDITDKVLKSYTQKDILSIEIPKTSTLSLKLEGDRAFFDLLSQDHEIRVTDNGVVFWGFVDGSISVDYIKDDLYEGSAKYYDFTKKLIGTNGVLHYTNIQIAGTNNALLESLFNEMMSITGLDLTLSSSYVDASVIDEIYIPEGKILNTFYDFLYYNGLTFYIKGKTLYIYDMLSVPTESWIVEDCASLKKNFNFGKVESNPLVYASKVVSKEQRIFTYAEEAKGEIVPLNTSFPITEDEIDTLTCNYDIELEENEELISVNDVGITQEVVNNLGNNVNIDVQKAVSQRDCEVKFTNTDWQYVLFDNFFIDANLKIQEFFQSSSIKANPDSEIKSVYLRDLVHVVRFLRYVVFLNGYGKLDYSFYSDNKMALGDMVSISGITEPLIVTQKTDKQDDFGGYDYKAVVYQSTVVDAITKKIAVSKYQKGYLNEVYSTQGFVFDGDFSTTLTCRVFFGSKEVTPKTYRWYRDVGLTGDTWTKDTKQIDITQEDLNGKASGLIWCETTYPNTSSEKKQVVNLAKSESRFLIEYAVSDNMDYPSLSHLGKFGNELYQFGTELIEVFEGAFWTTEQPQDDDKYVFVRITDGDSQTISLYATPKEKSISLTADNSGIFSVNQRGEVRNPTLSVTVKPTNFYIPAGDTNTKWYFFSTDWIQLVETSKTLVLPYSDFEYPLQIKAVYSFGANEVEDTIQISEIVSTSPTLHLGVLENAPIAMGTSVPAGFDEVGQAFVKGDSYVYFDGTDYVPYVFDGSTWLQIADANGDVPERYANIMIESANSVTSLGADIPVSSKAVYGYFRNLGAVNAFIENLVVQKFKAQTKSNNWELRINETEGLLQLDDKGGTITQLSPTGENVFKGTIEATSGTFKGQFDTSTLSTLVEGESIGTTTNINNIESLVSIMQGLVEPNTLYTGFAPTTLNGESVISAKYSDYKKYTLLFHGERGGMHVDYDVSPPYYYFYSGNVKYSVTYGYCEVVVNTDSSTYLYRLTRYSNIYGLDYYVSGVTGGGDVFYPEYADFVSATPQPINSYSELIGIGGAIIPANPLNDGNNPYDYFHSNNKNPLFPHPILNWGDVSDIKERLYIRNLTRFEPINDNRVWVDNKGYLRLKVPNETHQND